MRDWIKKHHIALILGIGGLGFFILFSGLNFTAPLRFNSPDETANYFFIEQLAENNSIRYFEDANYYLDGRVHPRSIQVVNGYLVPGGFLGIILIYGLLGKIITSGLTIYLTPLFSVLAMFAWYAIIKKYFNKWVALLSALLVGAHPAWWYYTARGLLPNVLFVSLAILSVFFILVRPIKNWQKKKKPKKKKKEQNWFLENIDWLVGGIFLAGSLMVRPSEIIWMMIIGLGLVMFNYKKINWLGLIIFLITTVIVFSPIFFLNNHFYGSPFKTGYQDINNRIVTEEDIGDESLERPVTTSEVVEEPVANRWVQGVKTLILPFGFSARNIWNNFVNYHIKFNWWYTVLWAAGLIFMAVQLGRKKISWPQAQLIIFFGVVSFWLVIVYGSWQFSDNINVGKVTIGNSYLRYWIPSFVLATPVIAYLLYHVGRIFKFHALQVIWAILIIAAFGAMGTTTTIFGEDEGLRYVRNHLWRYERISERVVELTEDNAIIITDRSDKIFFPKRKIVYPFMAEATYDLLPKMYFVAPTYYYSVALTEGAVEYLNNGILAKKGMRMEKIESFDNEALYIFKYLMMSNESNF